MTHMPEEDVSQLLNIDQVTKAPSYVNIEKCSLRLAIINVRQAAIAQRNDNYVTTQAGGLRPFGSVP